MHSGRLRFILILALLASNLLVGVMSLLFLRSMDQRYAALLDQSVPPINSLRTLTRELSLVQRLARRVVDPDNETTWKDLLPQMDEKSDLAKLHGREIAGMEVFAATRHKALIVKASEEYDAAVDHFLALARIHKFTEANQFNTTVLRPCYDNYQGLLDAAADHVQQQGIDLRARYAQDSRFFGGFLLAFAGWPLIAGAALILVMGVLVAGLLATVFFPKLFAPKPVES